MTTWLEVFANVMATVSIVLAGRNSIHTWFAGIIGCVAFAVVFFDAHLFADVALQCFFIVTSLIGWSRWEKRAGGRTLRIRHGNRAILGWAGLLGCAATGGYGALLYRFTSAYAPFWDSAVLVFSVIAQIFLMQRRIETWLFWLLVNTIAVPLYASRGLYLTSFLYAFYFANAIFSWVWWRRLHDDQKAAL